MYRSVVIIYCVCFLCYVPFSRIPDYFEGDYAKGVVSEATFSVKGNHPVVVVNYKVANEEFRYTSYRWFLTTYKPGQAVDIIYNPSHPAVASIYSFFGYWIRWQELVFTAIVFVILFIAAVVITGKNSSTISNTEECNRQRKYNE